MPRHALHEAHRRLSAIASLLRPASAELRALDADTLARQLELARIPAPTGQEHARAAVVARFLQECACKTHIDDAGNVIGALTPHRQSLLAPVVCVAHLDTVFDEDTPLTPTQSGTRITCPGIGDNGRGLAAMLALGRVLGRHVSNTATHMRPIEFVATVGEEGLGNLRGAHAYFANREAAGQPVPHAVVVLDGPGDQTIVHHALGSRRYRITFSGAGGHSWADFGTPNAVHAAGRATVSLAEVPRHMNGRVALTVSGIGGGESMNAIPANAYIDVDVRSTHRDLLLRVDVELRRLVQAAVDAECASAARNGHRGLVEVQRARLPMTHNVTLLGERPCGVLPNEHPMVQLAAAASIVNGIDPISAVASTDANVPLSLGIPAITIGGGGIGGGAHTLHEWYDNTNGPRGLVRAFSIVAALAA